MPRKIAVVCTARARRKLFRDSIAGWPLSMVDTASCWTMPRVSGSATHVVSHVIGQRIQRAVRAGSDLGP
eukprot:284213-Rhodomonas_salina.3